MLEIGILGKVDKIPDDGMRFYALIGLCVSTCAAIEQLLFRCYLSTCGRSQQKASKEFYRSVRFSHKFETVDKSVRAASESRTLERWIEISNEVRGVCGQTGARNLVSHNQLAADIYVKYNPDGTPDLEGGSALYMELAVNQSIHQVLTGMREPEKQTYETLRSYAYSALGAELRLMEFHRNSLEHIRSDSQ